MDSQVKLNEDSVRLISWFIKSKRRIAWESKAEDLVVTPDGIFRVEKNGPKKTK